MTSATLFLKNKYLLVLSVLVILVAGLSALVSMPRLEDPRIVNRNPLIVTLVPGASAERVEALVTEKLEEQLQEVPEIQEMRSTSRAGVSIIAVELADRVYESQKIFSLICDKIAEAEPELPREAATPFLDDQRGPVAYSLIVGVVWEHTSEPKLGILNRLAEELADQLRTIAGTQVVRLFGAPREEITVTVDPKELAALGMTSSDLAASIRAADSKVPAGMLRSGRDDLILEVAGELDSLARIGSIPLREGTDGTLLRLSDIARAERDWRSPPREIGLADGRRAVYVGAKVQAHRRVDEWAEEALEIVDAFAAGVGDGIAVEVVFDQTRYTNERLADLGMNLLAGALVVVVVIFFVMGWRSSVVVASALPLTAAIALFGTALTGGALHQISIFGMVVALGLLIDNAIVVVDEVKKHLERGTTPAEAVSASVRHLFVPLAASTVTTVLAFAPIVLMPGSVGDFVGSIGGSAQLWLDADEDEARLAGLSLSDIATQLQGGLEGTLGGSVIEDLEELDVRIRFEDERRRDLFDIRSTQLTAAGRPGWTPLSVLGELVLRPEVSAITRHDGLRANLIYGYTQNDALAIDVTDDVLTQLEETGFFLPSGYRLSIGGDAEDENKAIGNLMIYLPVLLTLMIATIVLSFRSVRLAGVLGVVAIQSVGLALFATWAYGFPVSFTTILGTLGLIGVALNDSIVVLAAIRSNPPARRGEVEAMADEVMGTLRHVISTTLTTVGGFLPLLIFVGGDFWPPLAIVLAGGVSGATILAVVFVPAAYRLVMTTSFSFRWLTEARRLGPLFSAKSVES